MEKLKHKLFPNVFPKTGVTVVQNWLGAHTPKFTWYPFGNTHEYSAYANLVAHFIIKVAFTLFCANLVNSSFQTIKRKFKSKIICFFLQLVAVILSIWFPLRILWPNALLLLPQATVYPEQYIQEHIPKKYHFKIKPCSDLLISILSWVEAALAILGILIVFILPFLIHLWDRRQVDHDDEDLLQHLSFGNVSTSTERSNSSHSTLNSTGITVIDNFRSMGRLSHRTAHKKASPSGASTLDKRPSPELSRISSHTHPSEPVIRDVSHPHLVQPETLSRPSASRILATSSKTRADKNVALDKQPSIDELGGVPSQQALSAHEKQPSSQTLPEKTGGTFSEKIASILKNVLPNSDQATTSQDEPKIGWGGKHTRKDVPPTDRVLRSASKVSKSPVTNEREPSLPRKKGPLLRMKTHTRTGKTATDL